MTFLSGKDVSALLLIAKSYVYTRAANVTFCTNGEP